MAWALELAPPSIKGARKKRWEPPVSAHHTWTCNSYSLDHLPGNHYKWIPRDLRTVSLPKLFTTKKAYAEVELKMGTWKKKTTGDNFLSLMETNPLILQLVTGTWDPGESGGKGEPSSLERSPVLCLPSAGGKNGAKTGKRVLDWEKKSSESTEEMGQQWWQRCGKGWKRGERRTHHSG